MTLRQDLIEQAKQRRKRMWDAAYVHKDQSVGGDKIEPQPHAARQYPPPMIAKREARQAPVATANAAMRFSDMAYIGYAMPEPEYLLPRTPMGFHKLLNAMAKISNTPASTLKGSEHLPVGGRQARIVTSFLALNIIRGAPTTWVAKMMRRDHTLVSRDRKIVLGNPEKYRIILNKSLLALGYDDAIQRDKIV